MVIVENNNNVETAHCKGGDCLLRSAATNFYVAAKLEFTPSSIPGKHSGEYQLKVGGRVVGEISFVTAPDGAIFIWDTVNNTRNAPDALKDVGATLVGAVIQGLPADQKITILSSFEALDFWKKLGFVATEPGFSLRHEATVGEINDKLLARRSVPNFDSYKTE